jgi:hypothetical protein
MMPMKTTMILAATTLFFGSYGKSAAVRRNAHFRAPAIVGKVKENHNPKRGLIMCGRKEITKTTKNSSFAI